MYFSNNDNQKKIIQKAITNLKIIKKNTDFSFLELNPITGRKHQIRKQLYAINHPIVFDQKYYLERNKKEKNNLLLHAYKIKFMINNRIIFPYTNPFFYLLF